MRVTIGSLVAKIDQSNQTTELRTGYDGTPHRQWAANPAGERGPMVTPRARGGCAGSDDKMKTLVEAICDPSLHRVMREAKATADWLNSLGDDDEMFGNLAKSVSCGEIRRRHVARGKYVRNARRGAMHVSA